MVCNVTGLEPTHCKPPSTSEILVIFPLHLFFSRFFSTFSSIFFFRCLPVNGCCAESKNATAYVEDAPSIYTKGKKAETRNHHLVFIFSYKLAVKQNKCKATSPKSQKGKSQKCKK